MDVLNWLRRGVLGLLWLPAFLSGRSTVACYVPDSCGEGDIAQKNGYEETVGASGPILFPGNRYAHRQCVEHRLLGG